MIGRCFWTKSPPTACADYRLLRNQCHKLNMLTQPTSLLSVVPFVCEVVMLACPECQAYISKQSTKQVFLENCLISFWTLSSKVTYTCILYLYFLCVCSLRIESMCFVLLAQCNSWVTWIIEVAFITICVKVTLVTDKGQVTFITLTKTKASFSL